MTRGFDSSMRDKQSTQPPPASLARAERQRLAQEEGARAMADAERQAVEVRRNMQRLRALREAREAVDDQARATAPHPVKKRRGRRVVK